MSRRGLSSVSSVPAPAGEARARKRLAHWPSIARLTVRAKKRSWMAAFA